ncbi:MAG: hypothetical protein V3U65_14830 [Granulosicoccaceae bacterium]
MTNRNTMRLALASVVLALASFASPSYADDGYLVFSTAALHFKNQDERRALVPGVGWEYSPTKKLGFHVGTLSDSFGFQATYAGINYGTPRFWNNKARFLIGATIIHKQFHKNTSAEAKIVPFPVLEIALAKNAVLNISGSPKIDYAGSHSNGVMFFQVKFNLR